MGKKKKTRKSAIERLEREGKSEAGKLLNTASPTFKRKMKEDFAVVEEILQSDPSLYDTLFDALNNKINSGRVSIKELREVFTELMGNRAGSVLFWLLDMSPYQSKPFLEYFGVSESTLSWLRRCFIAFGTTISKLGELEESPEDWQRLRVERLRKDDDDQVLINVEIERVDGTKQRLFGTRKSLFQLAVKLMDQVTNGGTETEGCQEKFLLRAKKILKEINYKKTLKRKKKK